MEEVSKESSGLPKGYISCAQFTKGRSVLVHGDPNLKECVGVIFSKADKGPTIMVTSGATTYAVAKSYVFVNPEKEKKTSLVTTSPKSTPSAGIVIPAGYKPCNAFYYNAAVDILKHDKSLEKNIKPLLALLGNIHSRIEMIEGEI